jgi:CRISPR-associated protein Csd1
VLERIQQDANPGTNTTLRDSYFGSAMSTPGAVFPTIVRRNQHHMAKLRKEKPGLAVNRDKLMQAILNDGMDCTIGFPATLSLPDQGRFVIGYYQQRQALYEKSQTQPETSEEGSVQ